MSVFTAYRRDGLLFHHHRPAVLVAMRESKVYQCSNCNYCSKRSECQRSVAEHGPMQSKRIFIADNYLKLQEKNMPEPAGIFCILKTKVATGPKIILVRVGGTQI